MTMPTSCFHLAFNVTDLDIAERFYVDVLGAQPGRRSDTWVDVVWMGHQLSMHLGTPFATANTGCVDTHMVPMPHFGLVVLQADWEAMRERLESHRVPMVIEPQVRFKGQPGEQSTLFFKDPFGNPIEIKGYRSWKDVAAST
ncbi:MAG: hypothetical protein RL357_213 [Pseudomonadota bacterium]